MTPLSTREVTRFQDAFDRLRGQLERVIKAEPKPADAPPDYIDLVLYALFAGGHVLIEGLPGLGKTELVKALGRLTALKFRRIQFTPDLMPSDLLGTQVLQAAPDRSQPLSLHFQPGPLFANLVLADEINRASPKVQSALLEAMGERQITIDGRTMPLDVDPGDETAPGPGAAGTGTTGPGSMEAGRRGGPFLVIATQNPIEMEGTFRLPEAQLDRFLFHVDVPYPGTALLETILRETTGAMSVDRTPLEPLAELGFQNLAAYMAMVRRVEEDERTLKLAARAIRLSLPVDRPGDPGLARVKEAVDFGSSPRGGQALILGGKVRALSKGRSHLAIEDLLAVAVPTLRHRLVLNHHGRRAARGDDRFLEGLIQEIMRAAAR
jgi:MoxR-like ATPase